ncbi:hypothetical protein AWENTII_010421 [Aspergillus wentii]
MNKEISGPRKRESRAGTRKVTSLSAEQLERKRANDREAQRTIRQRTKEHIEQLEHQVAELKAKGDRYDDIVRRNVALEGEINQLRHQLSMVAGGQGYSNPQVSYAGPPGPTIPSQLNIPTTLGVHPVPRAPSVLSSSSQVSLAHDWQHYSSTRSPSICESSDADYPNKVESFGMFEGQLQAPRISQAPPSMTVPSQQVPSQHMGYAGPGGNHPPPDPTPQPFPPFYQTDHSQERLGGDLQQHPHQLMPPVPSQRSTSVPAVPPERDPTRYPIFQATPQYQPPIDQQQRNQQFNYWAHQP